MTTDRIAELEAEVANLTWALNKSEDSLLRAGVTIQTLRNELIEARLSAQEAWEHTDDLMEMREHEADDDYEQRSAQRAKDWARGADFALHYVGGASLLEDATRYNPFLDEREG